MTNDVEIWLHNPSKACAYSKLFHIFHRSESCATDDRLVCCRDTRGRPSTWDIVAAGKIPHQWSVALGTRWPLEDTHIAPKITHGGGEGGEVNIEFSTFVCLVLCLSHPITCTGYWGATLLDVAYLILPLNNGRLQGLAISSRNLVTMILPHSSLAVRTCLQSLTLNIDSINSVSMLKQCMYIYIYT